MVLDLQRFWSMHMLSAGVPATVELKSDPPGGARDENADDS